MRQQVFGNIEIVVAQMVITGKTTSSTSQGRHYDHVDNEEISQSKDRISHQMPEGFLVLPVIPHQGDGDEKQPQRHVFLTDDKQHHKQAGQSKTPLLQEIQKPRQHHGRQHVGMVIEGKRLDDTEREEESRHGKNRQHIIVGIELYQFIHAPTAEQDTGNLHDEQGVAPEHINQWRQEHQIQVEMVAQHAARCPAENEIVVDAKVGIVVHDVGIEPQIERIGLEEVMVDQGDEAIQHASKGENRCHRDVSLSLTQRHRLHAHPLIIPPGTR